MDFKELTTYEAICKVDGVDPVQSLPFPKFTSEEEKAVNEVAKNFRIVRVLNGGWMPDWYNWDERKWMLWFDMSPEGTAGGSAAGFSFGDVDGGHERSHVGSRLVFKTREIAEHYAEHFLEVSRGWMVIES